MPLEVGCKITGYCSMDIKECSSDPEEIELTQGPGGLVEVRAKMPMTGKS